MTTTFSVLAFASVTCLSLGLATPALAQVNDAQRAAARDLFKAGDQAQRAGQFADALDKFQRAQQVFPAPTNVLRIAECDAALGRLVEAAEAYREVLRTPLPAGAPPAFQAAVDQAKAELSQVDPRVPKMTVQVQPTGVQGAQMQIDGQSVSAALIGEPMPLDPGAHKLALIAPGYASTEQSVDLKEHETRTVTVTLNAIPGITYAPAGTPPPPPAVTSDTPPPPPAIEAPDEGPAPTRPSSGLVLGLHVGFEGVSGKVPTPGASGFVSAGDVGNTGLDFGLDGAFRFARRWLVGLTLDRANFSNGSSLDGSTSNASSNTTYLGVTGAYVVNPDHVSFYVELNLGARWYDVREPGASAATGGDLRKLYTAGEGGVGIGVWIPAGRSFRILPRLGFGFAQLSEDTTTSSDTATAGDAKFVTFTTLTVTGLYNLDF
jgi:hypothetical protein